MITMIFPTPTHGQDYADWRDLADKAIYQQLRRFKPAPCGAYVLRCNVMAHWQTEAIVGVFRATYPGVEFMPHRRTRIPPGSTFLLEIKEKNEEVSNHDTTTNIRHLDNPRHAAAAKADLRQGMRGGSRPLYH